MSETFYFISFEYIELSSLQRRKQCERFFILFRLARAELIELTWVKLRRNNTLTKHLQLNPLGLFTIQFHLSVSLKREKILNIYKLLKSIKCQIVHLFKTQANLAPARTTVAVAGHLLPKGNRQNTLYFICIFVKGKILFRIYWNLYSVWIISDIVIKATYIEKSAWW